MKTNIIFGLLFAFVVLLVFTTGFYSGAHRTGSGIDSGKVSSHSTIVIFNKVLQLPDECFLLAGPSIAADKQLKFSCKVEGLRYMININEREASSLAHLDDLEQQVSIEEFELGVLSATRIQLDSSKYPVYQICNQKLCMVVQPALPVVMNPLLIRLEKL